MMKCSTCLLPLQLLSNQTYHFPKSLSGLDNLYLTNMTLEVCSQCGETIPHFYQSPQLLQAIALAISLQPCPLNGDDLRFLRQERALKAKDWAALLRIDPATLSRWEHGEQRFSPQADTLIRTLYRLLLVEQNQLLLPTLTPALTPKLSLITSEREAAFAIYLDTQTLTCSYLNLSLLAS